MPTALNRKKSARTAVKQEAIQAAKQFFDDINFQQRVGPNNKHELFEEQAVEWFTLEQARCTLGQITPAFFNTLVKRFNKHVSPFFSGKLVGEISFVQLELFLAVLAQDSVSQGSSLFFSGGALSGGATKGAL